MLSESGKNLLIVLFYCLVLANFAAGTEGERSMIIKKELKSPNEVSAPNSSAPVVPVESLQPNTVSELLEKPQHSHQLITAKTIIDSVNNKVLVDEPLPKNRYRDDIEIPESFKTGFYIFIGLSVMAILFIVAKIYGLRLSRAERKYGVQGDRTTQELTPLPIAIEDDESENENHTLFEVNRQTRIL